MCTIRLLILNLFIHKPKVHSFMSHYRKLPLVESILITGQNILCFNTKALLDDWLTVHHSITLV